jgi:ubiquinone biosynthesis protein UbiJ
LADAAYSLRAKLPADLPQSFTPPAWAVVEVQQRVVLLLNHILIQEPAARDRLQRQKGRQVQICWCDQVFQCAFTPAGLVEFITPEAGDKPADLVLRVNEPSAFELAKTMLQGEKPAIRIEGDVQLAAEVNWLIDHVRWDPEEDVARLFGDSSAHILVQTAKRAIDALRSFVQQQTSKAAP